MSLVFYLHNSEHLKLLMGHFRQVKWSVYGDTKIRDEMREICLSLSISLSLSLSMQQVHLSHRWSHCKAEKVLRSAPRARSYNASKNSISANQRAAGNHNVVLALLNGLFMAISGVGGEWDPGWGSQQI